MTVNINGKNITLKYSFRALIIYEKITNEVFAPKNLTNILIYFYSTIMASDKECTLTFESFTDWLDANPIEMDNFSKWLNEVAGRNGYINGNTDENTEVEPKKE